VVYYFGAISLLLGLVVGSFLNVVIYRLPLGESLVHPGSHCPRCGMAVRWYDNVPVVGWLTLRGKCRDCHEPISFRYPLVEAITGVMFVIAYWRLGIDWPLLVVWAFIAAMICVALIDLDHMIIPDKIVLPGALIGLLASIAINPQDWWKYLAAGLGAAAFMFLLVMVWPGGMGPGDVKMALLMGAVLGVSVLVALFLAFLFGAIAGILLVATRRRSRKDPIPFGPSLALGAIIAVLAGQGMLQSYVHLLQ
jgi:leader peptidase (prepilin peptidase)/N-methyltransferase